ncbi:DUF3786 domain-containing protein [Desulforhopalus singaporensis]|uniref:DUF3786 domain-containing protein n=1 Tax=Desulforhopalus singaporensis TaxID=91360 RepID=A0A1H0J2S3_9BACT|nr:DUF3786 domain-containing protein [Desulforhopalus singaporensis]SDO38047.1 protein of unknown function [Desulforhopalus singaporensis]
MSIIDDSYFQELLQCSPETTGQDKNCYFDPVTAAWRIKAWDQEYLILPGTKEIRAASAAAPPMHDYFGVFLLYYLLRTQPGQYSHEWISEKDLAGGPTFFRGPHAIPTSQISDLFANDLDAFKKRCTELQGQPINLADGAFSFTIVPGIRVAVLYWIGDDDFPAEARVLYDRSVEQMLTLDVVFALAVEVCHRISLPVRQNR